MRVGGPVHIGGVLHIVGTGSDFVWGRDVGLVIGHGEEDSRVQHEVISSCDRETCKEATGW